MSSILMMSSGAFYRKLNALFRSCNDQNVYLNRPVKVQLLLDSSNSAQGGGSGIIISNFQQ